MDLVFLYGPPAAGKFTVGRELARLTGYTLFHNHQSIDWARELVEFDTPAFWRMVFRLRMTALEELVAEGTNLVTTFVYLKDFDLSPIDALCQKVAERGGRTCFVRLSCDRDVIEARVASEERVAMRKLASLESLSTYLETHDVWQAIPERESLHLDTTSTPAAETATRIVERLGLTVVHPLSP